MAVRAPSRLMEAFKNLRKTFRLVRQQENFVGEDENGNKYYEKPSDSSRDLRKFRRVQPRSSDQFEVPEVPVEWMTWLQGRRVEAPSEEERERNYVTMLKTLRRAEELEDKRMVEDAQADLDKAQMTSIKQGRDFPTYAEYEKIPGQKLDNSKDER